MTYPIWLHYYANYTRVQSTAGLDSKILILEIENFSNETFKNSNRKPDYNFPVVEHHEEIL